jgi:hypothetical protein
MMCIKPQTAHLESMCTLKNTFSLILFEYQIQQTQSRCGLEYNFPIVTLESNRGPESGKLAIFGRTINSDRSYSNLYLFMVYLTALSGA